MQFIKLSSETDLSGNIIDLECRDAYISYKEIYNNAMVRGKGSVDPESLMGNPVQLEVNNFVPLLNQNYYTGMKADGVRFFMLISNGVNKLVKETVSKGTDIKLNYNRSIYFVDNKLSFWILTSSMQMSLNSRDPNRYQKNILTNVDGIDKCLIDGELILKGFNKDQVTGIWREINNSGYVIFNAFDLLYGPTDPQFPDERKNKVHDDTMSDNIVFGSSGSMVGFKESASNWITNSRRFVLETMFNNERSSLIQYLQGFRKNMYTEEGSSFTVIVSPFVSFDSIIDHFRNASTGTSTSAAGKESSSSENIGTDKDYYTYMKSIYSESFKKQLVRNNLYRLLKKKDLKAGLLTSLASSGLYGSKNLLELFQFPGSSAASGPSASNDQNAAIFNKSSELYIKLKDLHIESDGLIFTPIDKTYVIGPWMAGPNICFKWKPVNELTIDFQLGSLVPGRDVYQALVKNRNSVVPFEYRVSVSGTDVGTGAVPGSVPGVASSEIVTKKCYIKNESYYASISQGIKTGNIYECEVANVNTIGTKSPEIIFVVRKERSDKTAPNAYLTAVGTLNAIRVPNLLSTVALLRLNKSVPHETSDLIVKNMNEQNLLRIFYDLNKGPNGYYVFNSEMYNLFKNFISLVKNGSLRSMYNSKNKSIFELESRMTFKSEKDPYAVLLINETIKKKYTPVAFVRKYYKRNSVTFSSDSSKNSRDSEDSEDSGSEDPEGLQGSKESDKNSGTYRLTYLNTGTTAILIDVSYKHTLGTIDVPIQELYPEVRSLNIVIAKEIQLNIPELDTESTESDTESDTKSNQDFSESSDSLNLMSSRKSKDTYEKKSINEEPQEQETVMASVKKSEQNSDLELSKELIEKIENSSDFRYQIRYVVSNVSIYWKIEIIEETYGPTLEIAIDRYEKGPVSSISRNGYKTRIEIEYDPLYYFWDTLKFYTSLINNSEMYSKYSKTEYLKKINILDNILLNSLKFNTGTSAENSYEFIKNPEPIEDINEYFNRNNDIVLKDLNERSLFYNERLKYLESKITKVPQDIIARDYIRTLRIVLKSFYN